ncbi:MAG: helix-turn-helix transcriptional regulator [Hydrococcus sp. RU_2_2]|nr:helix-turn-helix transcriptional regulator [Hydrococcus sp. RU_2_2]NJP21498.1 helix-turn-helix transcriptional regulator [Hydrococcus sp. CRU_1_1]
MPVKVLLQEVRKLKGLSQNELARLTDMSPQNIQKIEQGEAKSLTFKTLERFCKVLNCQPGDLLVYEDDFDSEPQKLADSQKEEKTSKRHSKDSDQPNAAHPPRRGRVHSLPNVVCSVRESA